MYQGITEENGDAAEGEDIKGKELTTKEKIEILRYAKVHAGMNRLKIYKPLAGNHNKMGLMNEYTKVWQNTSGNM